MGEPIWVYDASYDDVVLYDRPNNGVKAVKYIPADDLHKLVDRWIAIRPGFRQCADELEKLLDGGD